MFKRPDLRAALDLAVRDAGRHFLVAGLPAVVAIQLWTLGTAYLVPPMGRRDHGLLQVGQGEFATWALSVALWLGWLVLRSESSHGNSRHRADWGGVAVDLVALAASLTMSLLLFSVFSPVGSILGAGVAGYLASLSASLPLIALAPGLVRLRVPTPAFLTLVLILLLGLVGFFGRYSPIPADTVLPTTGVGTRCLADALVAAACLLISLTIAYSRSPNTRCGSAS